MTPTQLSLRVCALKFYSTSNSQRSLSVGSEYFATEQFDLRIFQSGASFRTELICFFFFSHVSSCVLAKHTKNEANDLKCTEQKKNPLYLQKTISFFHLKKKKKKVTKTHFLQCAPCTAINIKVLCR